MEKTNAQPAGNNGGENNERIEPPRLRGIQRPRRTTAIAVMGLFILALFYTFYLARELFLPIVLAWILSLLFKPLVTGLKRLRIPEAIGGLVVLLAIIGIIAGGLLLVSEPASKWMSRAPETLKLAETKIRAILSPAQKFTEAAAEVEKLGNAAANGTGSDERPVPQVEIKRPGMLGAILRGTTNVVFLLGETIVLLYFLLVGGDLLMLKAIQALPRFTAKKRAVEIAHEVQHQVSRYLGSITMLNIFEGTLVGIGMAIAGLPNPILWGVMAALVNYIPYLGAMTAITVISIVSLVTFDSPGRALAPPLIYLGINLSDNFIAPFFLGRRLVLNPVIIFLTLMFWGWLWGIIGVLLAVPITMTFKIICDHFESLAPIGELLSGEHKPAAKVDSETVAASEAAVAGGKA